MDQDVLTGKNSLPLDNLGALDLVSLGVTVFLMQFTSIKAAVSHHHQNILTTHHGDAETTGPTTRTTAVVLHPMSWGLENFAKGLAKSPPLPKGG